MISQEATDPCVCVSRVRVNIDCSLNRKHKLLPRKDFGTFNRRAPEVVTLPVEEDL